MSQPVLPPGIDQVYRQDDTGDGCRLMAAQCRHSRRIFFPAPAWCPCCLEPPEALALSGRGTIHAFTVVRVKAPFGLPEPYAVGYVDLDAAPLRIFGLLMAPAIADLRTGLAVDLVVMPLGVDNRGEPCLRPVFRPLSCPGGGDDV